MKNKTSLKIRHPQIKMGNKPIEIRIWKMEDRIHHIETQMGWIFKTNRVKAGYDSDSFYTAAVNVYPKDKPGYKRLHELYLQKGLAKVRLEYYQDILFNNLPE